VILVDTSVWVDHLRKGDRTLVSLLEKGSVLTHPFVIGEIALGNLRQRRIVLDGLRHLPRATIASDQEVFLFIEQNRLFGAGIGYLDAHLLAAVRLTPGANLWTRDRRLHAVAERLNLATRSVR
jgi:predicted nucleic acid-binding protein